MIIRTRWFHLLIDVPSPSWDMGAHVFLGVGPWLVDKPTFINRYRWSLEFAWDWLPSFHYHRGNWWGSGDHRLPYSPNNYGDVYDSRAWTGRKEELWMVVWPRFFRITKDPRPIQERE